tara:strand:- start:606 stop:791 length:186 start_codon:yes stop_codon:yes gene_type:complete
MQFQKKTSAGRYGGLIKTLIRVVLFFIIVLLLVVLVDRINFPYPNKKIEKIITNENFKVLK